MPPHDFSSHDLGFRRARRGAFALLASALACSAQTGGDGGTATLTPAPSPAPGWSAPRAVTAPAPEQPPANPPAVRTITEHAAPVAALAQTDVQLADDGELNEPEPDAPMAEAAPAGIAPDGAAAALPADDTPAGPWLIAGQREVLIYEKPSVSARRVGYLRAGTRVQRAAEPEARGERCPGGFYRVAPYGYACASKTVLLDRDNAVSTLAQTRADRTEGLPYLYGRSKFAPPLYVKLPTAAEQREVEPERLTPGAFAALPLSPVPATLAEQGRVPTPFGYNYDRERVSVGRAVGRSTFALLSLFEHEKRRYGLTTNLLLVPLDHLEPVAPSTFRGIALDEVGLPVAFVMGKNERSLTGAPGRFKSGRLLGYREAVPLSGESERVGGRTYVRTRSGEWLDDARLVRVEAPKTLPAWAEQGKSWIRVSITQQTLVAFQGAQPVYATLVSTGADGLGDPATTHSTIQGQFLIHTKHVSATMDGNEVGDEFSLEDVPYVQYFRDNFALHAAYWHDGFGTARSHGCINLAPLDARWLFGWTEPAVPRNFHGAFSLRDGTLIDIGP